MPSPSPARFLIVEDEPAIARVWWRLLKDFRPTVVAHSVAEARALLDGAGRWCGFLFDVELGDGSGLDLLAAARARYAGVPALIATGHLDTSFIRRTHALDAHYLCKPADLDDLLPFVYRALGADAGLHARVAARLSELARRHALSPREAEILVAAVTGVPREVLLQQFGITENTYKSQVRGLLKKFEATDLATLALGVLRAAIAA
jgi:DNA-binding NarL/FixJ family response regulator